MDIKVWRSRLRARFCVRLYNVNMWVHVFLYQGRLMLACFWHAVLYGHVHRCIGVCYCVRKRVRIDAMFFNSHWIKAFYNPLSRHNSTSLTMDLSLLCLLIIVPIHMISRFMIPLAFAPSHHATHTNISTFAAVKWKLLARFFAASAVEGQLLKTIVAAHNDRLRQFLCSCLT